MKGITVFIIVILILVVAFRFNYLAPGPGIPVTGDSPSVVKANNGDHNSTSSVKLNALAVKKAGDIENAIHLVTDHGKHGGTIILDGSEGPFIYTETEDDDRRIDIDYSNVTIEGKNGAFFANANTGFRFKDAPLQNITIKNVSMICDVDGIDADGHFMNVTITGNTVHATQYGIVIDQGEAWTITQNTIDADQKGILVSHSHNINIDNNMISAPTAIEMSETSNSKIDNNKIGPADLGIKLLNSIENMEANKNYMGGIATCGFSIYPPNINYQLNGNTVSCITNKPCNPVCRGQ